MAILAGPCPGRQRLASDGGTAETLLSASRVAGKLTVPRGLSALRSDQAKCFGEEGPAVRYCHADRQPQRGRRLSAGQSSVSGIIDGQARPEGGAVDVARQSRQRPAGSSSQSGQPAICEPASAAMAIIIAVLPAACATVLAARRRAKSTGRGGQIQHALY